MQRGPEDAGGANHPCLLMTGERWWLFYTGYPGSGPGQRSVLVAAVSQTGASWDRVGAILEPEAGEVAVSHPCALEVARAIYAFLRQRRRRSDPNRDGDLIRRPLMGPPWHGPGTRRPGARRFERPHSLRGEASRRVRWDVVRRHSDRRRRARLPHLLRAVPRALVALKRRPGIRLHPVGVRNSDHVLDLGIRSGRRRRASDSKEAREASARHSIRLPWLPNCPSAEPLRTGLESLGLRSQPNRLAAGFSLGLQGRRFAPI